MRPHNTPADAPAQSLTLSGRDSLDTAVRRLLRGTRHSLRICAVRLELPVFTSTDLHGLLTPIITTSPHNRIRVLLKDPAHFQRYNTTLRELARRFGSYIEIRGIGAAFPRVSEFFVIADMDGYVFQPRLDQSRGVAGMGAAETVRELHHVFTSIWEDSEPIVEISRLGL